MSNIITELFAKTVNSFNIKLLTVEVYGSQLSLVYQISGISDDMPGI